MEAETSLLLPDENVGFFNLHVPEKVQKALLQRILQCYRDASQHCYKHFRAPQAKDLSGHYRRSRIEDEFAGIADRFRKDGVSFEEVLYKRNTGYHVQLRSGLVTTTQSCVLSKDDLPRNADFRETLASTGQREMFGDGEDEVAEAGVTLYAVLLHGVAPGARQRERCAFACVRFPDSKFQSYLGGTKICLKNSRSSCKSSTPTARSRKPQNQKFCRKRNSVGRRPND